MTHATVSVNEQGRVTIPAQLRHELGLRVGSQLVAYVEDGRLILEDRAHLLERVQEAVLKQTGDTSLSEELLADRRAEVAREREEKP